jgi:hypothetical protein
VPPTPESEPRTSPTYADIVKRSSSGKNHHQQPQRHKLKSIIIDPSRLEVRPRHAGLQVRFADNPHLSPSAMRSSCSASSGINSSWNTWERKVECSWEELHPSPIHRSSNDGSTTRLSPRIRKITEGRCFICLARGHWLQHAEIPSPAFGATAQAIVSGTIVNATNIPVSGSCLVIRLYRNTFHERNNPRVTRMIVAQSVCTQEAMILHFSISSPNMLTIFSKKSRRCLTQRYKACVVDSHCCSMHSYISCKNLVKNG